MLKKIKSLFYNNWSDIERYDEDWKKRIEEMSSFIPTDCKSIVDLGAGKFWLKDFIPSHIEYFPVDMKKTADDTLVFDLNKKEFPDFQVDCYFCSGVIEYVKDLNWLFSMMTTKTNYIILSYCTVEAFNNKHKRLKNGWKNHYTSEKLVELVTSYDFKLLKKIIKSNTILVFGK